MARNLLLVYGGRSSEHEISIRSATEVLGAIDRELWTPKLIGIRRDGRMSTGELPEEPTRETMRALVDSGERIGSLAKFAKDCDVVFPLLHGPFGEDGTFQGLLEVFGLPYVGSGVLASALCMDKAAFKHFVSAPGCDVPVVPGITVDLRIEGLGAAFDRAVGAAHNELAYPVFVKPANQGSSVGVSKASNDAELKEALVAAAAYDPKILVEKAVDAREIELAVLGEGGSGTLVSRAGEILLPEGTWYDYDNKYENDVASYAIPTELPKELLSRLQELSLRAFRATGCHGLARVDFFVDRSTGEPYLNELNTMPGFTTISMYPKLMEDSGVPYGALITRLCELGIERAVPAE